MNIIFLLFIEDELIDFLQVIVILYAVK